MINIVFNLKLQEEFLTDFNIFFFVEDIPLCYANNK